MFLEWARPAKLVCVGWATRLERGFRKQFFKCLIVGFEWLGEAVEQDVFKPHSCFNAFDVLMLIKMGEL